MEHIRTWVRFAILKSSFVALQGEKGKKIRCYGYFIQHDSRLGIALTIEMITKNFKIN